MKIAAALSLSVMTTALLGGSALAADLSGAQPRAVYTKAPAMAVYDWTGFYLGANVGIGLGRNLTVWTDTPASYLNPFGAVGGVQAGYNWQRGNFVLGMEADIQLASMRDDRTCILLCAQGLQVRFDQKLDWFGTARARVGLADGPVLSYVTGGFAYGGVKTNVSENDTGLLSGASFNQTRTGWTLGSGVEAALGGNWTGKIEYLYVDLGSQAGTYANAFAGTRAVSSDIRENIFRAGVNYRIGGTAVTAPLAVANWAGLYIGGNVGSGIARNPVSEILTTATGVLASAETLNLSPQGSLGGAQIGYNWQAANWVFGIEADLDGSLQRDHKNCQLLCALSPPPPTFFAIDQRMSWFGTVRGRAGYSVGSSLFYATGGLAYGGVENRISEQLFPSAALAVKFNHTKTGFAVGGGLETPFDIFGLFGKNWTSNTEYLYVDLGKVTDTYAYTGLNHTIETRVQEHIFRTGLNYHFAPVTAKY